MPTWQERSTSYSDLESNILAHEILLSQDSVVVEPLRECVAIHVREPQYRAHVENQAKKNTKQNGSYEPTCNGHFLVTVRRLIPDAGFAFESSRVS